MPDESESERIAILALSDEEERAIVAGDLDRYLSVLTDDAVFLPPDTAPQSGAELRLFLQGFLEAVRIESLASTHGATIVAGDIAYHEYSCTWRTTPRTGGPSTVASFKGVHLARRIAGGSWRFARNIWNATPPGA